MLLQPDYNWRPPCGGMRNQTSQMDSPTARPAEPGKHDPLGQSSLGRVSAVPERSELCQEVVGQRCASRGFRRLGGSVVGGISGQEEGLGCSVIFSWSSQSLGSSVEPPEAALMRGRG